MRIKSVFTFRKRHMQTENDTAQDASTSSEQADDGSSDDIKTGTGSAPGSVAQVAPSQIGEHVERSHSSRNSVGIRQPVNTQVTNSAVHTTSVQGADIENVRFLP